MKHLLFLLLLLPLTAFAQWPAAPNKIRLGNQTTGDGLVVRTAAAPSWTPSTINNAWLAFDTVAVKLYYYDAGMWNEYTGGNFANSNLTFTGNRVHNLSTRTLTIADGGTYPTFQQSAATDGFTLASSATDLIAQTPGLLQIENSDTITITADRIRLNAADTRIQQVSKNNGLNRVMMIDSTTEQIYYRDVSSIAGGGGTVTGTGTTGTIPVWSSSTALGDSPLTVSSGDVTATGTGSFRLPNGTTAQRPGTPSAGMTRYNTSNGNLDFYGASAWENPLKSTTATGLGTAGRVFYADANGRAAADDNLYWNATNDRLGIGTNTPNYILHIKSQAGQANAFLEPGSGVNSYIFFTNSSNYIGSEAGGFLQQGTSYFSFRTTAGMATSPGLFINSSNFVGSGTSSPDRALHSERSGSSTSTVTPAFRITETTSATATTGFGTGMEYEAENASGTNRVIGQTEASYTTATNAAEVSDLVFRTMRGGTLTESLRSLGNGTLQIASLTDTGASIAGFTGTSGAGVLTRLSLGSGLSITSGTLSATGTGGTVTSVGITAPAAGITVSGSPVTTSGNMTLALADDLAAVEGISGTGMAARTASNTWTTRTITAGSGIAVSNGDGVSGNPTISRTYSLTHITISGGSTFVSSGTPERPDNDTPGSQTVSTIGSDFSTSGSTIDYTGASGALLRVQGTVSISLSDDGDFYLSMYKEGTEIAATSTRFTAIAGNYYTITLPATTVTGNTNDTFDIRVVPASGSTTTTMHRYGFIIERIY